MEFKQFTEALTIQIGSTFDPDPWTWSTGETEASALPVNLTGCSAEMHIRDNVDSETILLTLSTANGRLVLGGIAGTIAPIIQSADTSLITWSKGVYDVRITFPSGNVEYLVGGPVAAIKKVTRGG